MNALRTIGGIIFNPFIFRIVNLVVYIFYFVPSDFNAENIPMKIIFVWGIVLLIWDFFTKRIMFKQPHWKVLFALCVSYLFSIATNFPSNFMDSAYNFVYLATSVFIFYSIDPELDPKTRSKQFQLFNDIAISIIFLLTSLSLLTYFFNIFYLVPTGTEGIMARQGFLENRLFGLYTSPNMGSMFGYVSVFLMTMNNFLKRGDWKKFQKLYVVNAVVQYLYYLLSSSRGTQITIVGFMIFMYLIVTYKLFATKKHNLKKIARNFVALATLFFLMNVVNYVVEFGLSYVPSTISYFISSPEQEVVIDENGEMVTVNKKKVIEKITIQHSEEGSEVSSGRLSIWEAGLKLVKQKPVFGVADSDVYRTGELSPQLDESLLTELDKNELIRAHGNMHSTYIAVLVKAGIAGFIILCIFVLFILNDNIRFIGKPSFDLKNQDAQIYIIIFGFLLSLFVNDVVENHLIFNNRDVMGLIFWTYLGLSNRIRLESIEANSEAKEVE